jgi:hypothetical protein
MNEFFLHTTPNSENENHKTGESCNTGISVANSEFLQAIFGELTESRPIVVSFPGDPHDKIKKPNWKGQAWHFGTKTPTKHNNYISLASYTPDEGGQYRRKKEFFHAVHAFMLDDVGTKVSADRVTLEPSWAIETSPGNFQYGYILKEPLADVSSADKVLDAIIFAGLCDPGANGISARLCRLPVSINGREKYKDAGGALWQCRLQIWEPLCRYTVDELVEGLQIELMANSQKQRAAGKTGSLSTQRQFDEDDVHIPRAEENPVLTVLKTAGLYKQPLGGGKHDITCPWVNEHTGQQDNGTAYFEPSELWPIGGFKCQHGHCATRRVSTLHGFLGISRIEAKHRAMIRVQPGELPSICDAAEKELAKTLRYFQRSSHIVVISTDPSTSETTVKPLSLPGLARAMAGVAVWLRFDKRCKEWLICDPPEKYCKVLHDPAIYPHLPILNGIARQPYLRKDGSLVTNPDYDHATGMFGVFNPNNFSIPESPTIDQAKMALTELFDLLSEFEYKTENDKSAALSGILTAAIRVSLPHAPMFHIKAPNLGSGKTYHCELLTVFATPQKRSPHDFPKEDEECRKLLVAELLKAPAVIEFDNLTSDLLPHKSLAIALTSESLSGRILGQSKTVDVGTKTLFLSSGNNVAPIKDMTRRTITITLDPLCETPATRDFKRQPVLEVLANRGRFVSLALIIIRAWICAGRPQSQCKTINSFDEWSKLCRQPLLWLGLPDPAACIFESMTTDPDREKLSQMLHGWHEKFGTQSLMIREVLKRLSSNDGELWEQIRDIAGEKDSSINSNKLGWWMNRHAGRVVDGLRFIKDQDSNRGTAKWKTQVLPVLQVSDISVPEIVFESNITSSDTNDYARASRGV